MNPALHHKSNVTVCKHESYRLNWWTMPFSFFAGDGTKKLFKYAAESEEREHKDKILNLAFSPGYLQRETCSLLDSYHFLPSFLPPVSVCLNNPPKIVFCHQNPLEKAQKPSPISLKSQPGRYHCVATDLLATERTTC